MSLRVYSARWVLPISAPTIAHGAVAVEGQRIVWVGPLSNAPEGEHIVLGDVALLPGLVNAHSHLELTAMRGFLENLSFRPWILRLTQSREAVMTPEWNAASARVGIAEGLLAGITTFGDVSDAGTSLNAMRDMGTRGIIFQEVFGPSPAQCGGALAGLRTKVERLRRHETELVRVGVSPHAPYTVSDDLFRATAAFAREESLPLTVHIAESEAELELVRLGRGEFAEALRARGIAVSARSTTPVQLLYETGALDVGAILVHAIRTNRQDHDLMVSSGSRVVHCPASSAKLGHGIAPVLEMLERGIAVGLGSDSVASNNRMDVLDEGRLASLLQRARVQDPCVLPARIVLELATLGGARALGMEGDIGSLEAGKAADLVAFPLHDLGDVPVYAPEDALVYGAAGRRARLVTVAGRELVRDGALVAGVGDDVATVREASAALAAFVRAAAE